MKTIALRFAALLVLTIAGLLVYALTRPNTFQVERSLAINAPADTIRELISDFHQWNLWSPYEQLDPAMTRTFSGEPSGVGAVYEWAGNADVGAGRMEIIDSDSAIVMIRLDFIEPFENHSTAEFILEQHGDSTYVTWIMFGPNQFMGKFMGIFMDMDQMIGKDFEKGLVNLKSMTEGS